MVAKLRRQAAPLGDEVWGDTCLTLQRRIAGRDFRNIFTGETVSRYREVKLALLLAEVFRDFPVAVIETVND